MFPYFYSNFFYILLLLYSPKDIPKNFDQNIESYDKNVYLFKNQKTFEPRTQCSETNRIETFVRNSVQNLFEKLQTISDNSTELVVNIQSRINVRHLNILKQYLQQNYKQLNCEQLEEFEDSINQFIQSLVTISDNNINSNENSLKLLILDYFSFNSIQLCLYLLTFLLTIYSLKQLFNVLFRRQINFDYKRLLTKKSLIVLTIILLTLVSILWKWRQKYLIELSRKQCYVLATPDECLNRNTEVTFMSWIRHYMYSYEQRRHDYYRAVTVDPFWEINPLTVISELLSELVLTPLKPLGEYSGMFISSFFSGIPLYLVIPVFIFLCFVTLLLVLLIAVWILMPNRYSIKLPFLMTIQFDRSHQNAITDQTDSCLPALDKQNIIRKYQIRANVVNVYHSIGGSNQSPDNNLEENQINFDDSFRFVTNKPISIPYSEVD